MTTQTGAYNLVSTAPPIGSTIITDLITGLDYFVIGESIRHDLYIKHDNTNEYNPVLTNTTDDQIIGIQIVTTGNVSPLNVTSFTVNANGTNNAADISNAKIYYTGTSGTFATTNQFGSTVPAPTIADCNITGTQALAEEQIISG